VLNKENAIKIESKSKSNGGIRYTYTFICSYTGCQREIKARTDNLKNHSGMCRMHTNRKRPFESTYASMLNDHRGFIDNMSYEEFLEFTFIKDCHYCTSNIRWEPFGTIMGEFTTRAYYLDRKNNTLGHTKDNCVVSCTRCNRARGNRFSYWEWFTMTAPFRTGIL